MRIQLHFERGTQDHRAQYGAAPAEPGDPQPAIRIIRLSWEAWEEMGRPPAIDVMVEPAARVRS